MRRFRHARLPLDAPCGAVVLLALAFVVASPAGADAAGLTVGGHVPAARSLEIEQHVSTASIRGGVLDVTIAMPGNGRADYELILREGSAGRVSRPGVTFDGREIDLATGRSTLVVVGAETGRGPEHRLRVPAGGAEGHMTLVLRSR